MINEHLGEHLIVLLETLSVALASVLHMSIFCIVYPRLGLREVMETHGVYIWGLRTQGRIFPEHSVYLSGRAQADT